jgi:hypothetical protein
MFCFILTPKLRQPNNSRLEVIRRYLSDQLKEKG